MDKDVRILAKILGKKPRDVKLSDLQSLVGKEGTLPPVRSGLPHRRCIIKSFELTGGEVKVVAIVNGRKIKKPLSKLRLVDNNGNNKVAETTEHNRIKCACVSYHRKYGKHMQSCPMYHLDRGMQNLINDVGQLEKDDK